MAYVPCYACGIHHKGMLQREIIVILSEFQAGNAQRVSPVGINPMCILDVLKLPPAAKKMRELREGRLIDGVSGLDPDERADHTLPALFGDSASVA